jgi:flagellar hook-associated protein 2
MAGLQLSGLTSGLDTEAIISQLIAVESQPLARMSNDKTVATTRSQIFKDIESRLKNLKTSSDDLKSVLLWNPVQSVTSSNTDLFSAKATAGIAPGGHSVKITQMARAAQETYSWTPPATAGSLTINGVTVSVGANASIEDVASLVNGNSSLGVYAVNAGGQLVLTNRATGVPTTPLSASGDGITAHDASKSKAGLNAKGELDGVAFDQASNTITGSGTSPSAVNIPGLTITLKAVTTAAESIEVGVPVVDRDAVKAKLQAFVSNYNDALDFINGKLTEKKQTATDGAGNSTTKPIDYTKGVLFGDSGLRNILGAMRLAVSNPVSGTGLPATMTMLSQLGVSTGSASTTINADSVSGKLTFDADTFNAAMDSDPSSAQKLLGGVTGTDGFAQAFSSLLTPLVQVAGVLEQRVETANGQASDIDTQMAALNDRLTMRQEALRKQFTAMETALAANQDQLSSLLNMLGTSRA